MNILLTGLIALLITSLTGIPTVLAITLPTLPQTTMSRTKPTITGSTFTAASCNDLKTKLDSAAAASTSLNHLVIVPISLTCTLPFLPAHTGPGYIVVQTQNVSSLPAQGARVGTGDATNMPTFVYGNATNPYTGCGDQAALSASTGAQNYWVEGIRLLANASFTPSFALFIAGLGSCAYNNTKNIILSHMLMMNTDTTCCANTAALERCVLGDMDSGGIALFDSYCAGVRDQTLDTQAFLAVGNPGPITLDNNYFEAAGENVMIGGGQPGVSFLDTAVSVAGNTLTAPGPASMYATGTQATFTLGNFASALPAPLALNTNYFLIYVSTTNGISTFKVATSLANANSNTPLTLTSTGLDKDVTPDACTGGECTFGVSPATLLPGDITITHNFFEHNIAYQTVNNIWQMKTLLEIKHGNRILIEGNLFKRTWAGTKADTGHAFRFTVRGWGANISCFPSPNVVCVQTFASAQDVTFRYNDVRHVGGGFTYFSSDDGGGGNTQPASRYYFHDNLFADMGGPWDPNCVGSCGQLFGWEGGGPYASDSIYFSHNTFYSDHGTGGIIGGKNWFDFVPLTPGSAGPGGSPLKTADTDFILRDNIMQFGTNGIFGNACNGPCALDGDFGTGALPNGYLVTNNAVAGLGPSGASLNSYVVGSRFVNNCWGTNGSKDSSVDLKLTDIGFSNPGDLDTSTFDLTSGPFRKGQTCQASDATDLGVDWVTFNNVQAGGSGGGQPPPPPASPNPDSPYIFFQSWPLTNYVQVPDAL